MLIFIFILYQPTPGPGIIQRLGWQSWDVLSSATTANTTGGIAAGSPPPVDTAEQIPDGVDWWNVTTEEQVDSASLPLDVWAPLLPHDTGRASAITMCTVEAIIIMFRLVSEIAVTRCFVNPRLGSKLCDPESTTEKDAIRGKWVRVDRFIHSSTAAAVD